LNGKSVVIPALLIAIGISGCAPKAVPKPYKIELNVPPAYTKPLEPFPVLPTLGEDGGRDVCDMHIYRVKVEYILCAEYKRTNSLIRGMTEDRQHFQIPLACKSIVEGVKNQLHLACKSK